MNITFLARSCCAIAVLSITFLSGCTSLSGQRDPLCPEIARFANSVDDDDVHSVELRTFWGARPEGDEIVMGEKGCARNKLAPEIRLCDYLLNDTSTEFATINFRRALHCLNESESYLGPPEAHVEYLKGLITSYSVAGVRPDRLVAIEFSTGSNEELPSLKISAQR